MKIKNFVFLVCGSVFLNLYASAAADNLQSQLSFETARIFARPLMPENLDAAKVVDDSDESYVQVMDGSSLESLTGQARFLAENSKISQLGSISDLRYGIFEKGAGSLVGVYRIWLLDTNAFLLTSIKFHKKHQGKGYATEFTKGLFKRYQSIGLIPTSQDDLSTPYRGFSGSIQLTNKASLVCNVIKCGYRISSIFGNTVYVYYPFVTKNCCGFPQLDESSHHSVVEQLASYRSGSKEAERSLRSLSLQNLLSYGKGELGKVLAGDSLFLAQTMAEFPDMLDLISDREKETVKAIISEEIASLIEQKASSYPDAEEKLGDALFKQITAATIAKIK
ncbi:MAG: GNAT family protein [Proteobacteria bacterium]|nr:GNAT family protein [Pseudomonadota bacterium]